MIAIKVGRETHQVAVEHSDGQVSTFPITNDRAGFDVLLAALDLPGHNGHRPIGIEGGSIYGLPLIQFLGDRPMRLIPFPKKGGRRKREDKTALSVLAALKAGAGRPITSIDGQVKSLANRLEPDKDLIQGSFAWTLRRLVRDRETLVKESRRRKQRVRMILSVVFPELEAVFADPFGKFATEILDQAFIPAEVKKAKFGNRFGKLTPSKQAKLDALQRAAETSIGITPSHARYFSDSFKLALKELRQIEVEVDDKDSDISHLVVNSPWKALMEIKGVKELSAAKIVSEIAERPFFKSPAQMAAFAGLAPTAAQVQKDGSVRMRITRAGSALFRTTLYQIAKTAVRSDDRLKAWYQRMVNERKAAVPPRPVKPALIRIMDHGIIPRIYRVYQSIKGV